MGSDFRILPDIPHLMIFSDGRVYDSTLGLFVRGAEVGAKLKRGYRRLAAGGRGKVGIHRLVAEAWCGHDYDLPLSAMEVHHRDGDSFNNSASNLQWLPVSEHRLVDAARRRADVAAGVSLRALRGAAVFDFGALGDCIAAGVVPLIDGGRVVSGKFSDVSGAAVLECSRAAAVALVEAFFARRVFALRGAKGSVTMPAKKRDICVD